MSTIYDTQCEGSILVDDATMTCDLPATHKVVGEQDSFGAEHHYFCDTCVDEWYAELNRAYDAERERAAQAPCARCHRTTGDVTPWHIPDDQPWESDAWWCKACRQRYQHDLDEEMCGYDLSNARHTGRAQECWCGEHERQPSWAELEAEREFWTIDQCTNDQLYPDPDEPWSCYCGAHTDVQTVTA